MAEDDDKAPHGLSWWQRFKNLGKSWGSDIKDSMFSDPNNSTYGDWLKSLGQLQPLIRQMRQEIDSLGTKDISFDILGAGTFLLQIDLLLIKVRQHFSNYHRRKADFNHKGELSQSMLSRIETESKSCYACMEYLFKALKGKTYLELNDKFIIECVKSLETSTQLLSHEMQQLNELALKRDPVYQLFENELFKTLMSLEQGEHPHDTFKPSYPSMDPLRDKAHLIEEVALRDIASEMLSQYNTLKRSSDFYQNSLLSTYQSQLLTARLDAFEQHVSAYISIASQSKLDREKIIVAIQHLFLDLEAMRFVPLKTFSEKSKVVKQQLTQHLRKSELGLEALKPLQMGFRAKLGLKSRFRS